MFYSVDLFIETFYFLHSNYTAEIWTDGMTHIVPASFEWKTTGARVSDSLSLVKGHYYGRIISVTSATDRTFLLNNFYL